VCYGRRTMNKRSLRIPVALAWSALGGGSLCVALSCGGGTEPVPTCPGICVDAVATDSGPTPESGPTPDGSGFPDILI